MKNLFNINEFNDLNEFNDTLNDKFYKDFEFEAGYKYDEEINLFYNRLNRYRENEKLEIIISERKKTLAQIGKSKYERFFSGCNLKTNLREALVDYKSMLYGFKFLDGIEYNESLKKGQYRINSHTGILSVYKDISFVLGIESFSFAEFDCFKELPDYIYSRLMFYEFDRLEDEYGKKNNPEPKDKTVQLKTNLTTDTQRGLLFDLLVKDEFIPDNTDRDGFIWAFGGENDKYTGFKIKWLKKKNLAVYLIDKLCYNDAQTIQDNYLSVGERIFGINNMAQIRNGYRNNNVGNPLNPVLIDKIINTVRGAK